MKQRKSEDMIDHFNPEETCGSIASTALRQGNELPVGHYTRDVGKVLNLLANQFDPPGAAKRRWRATRSGGRERARPEERGEEWEGTVDQITDAVEHYDADAIGCYLREVAEILSRLANELDPPKSKRRRLEFVRKGRGRPKDTTLRTKFFKSGVRSHLAARNATGEKQESTIASLKAKRGLSRAKVFRIKGPSRKSHKKT